MVLSQDDNGVISGAYNPGSNWGWYGLDGRTAIEESTLGITAILNGGNLVASWAGRYTLFIIHLTSVCYRSNAYLGCSNDIFPGECIHCSDGDMLTTKYIEGELDEDGDEGCQQSDGDAEKKYTVTVQVFHREL